MEHGFVPLGCWFPSLGFGTKPSTYQFVPVLFPVVVDGRSGVWAVGLKSLGEGYQRMPGRINRRRSGVQQSILHVSWDVALSRGTEIIYYLIFRYIQHS